MQFANQLQVEVLPVMGHLQILEDPEKINDAVHWVVRESWLKRKAPGIALSELACCPLA